MNVYHVPEGTAPSGIGIRAKQSRCYSFWHQYDKCQYRAAAPEVDCSLFYEDFMECLHHTKEISRMKRVMRELKRAEKVALAKATSEPQD